MVVLTRKWFNFPAETCNDHYWASRAQNGDAMLQRRLVGIVTFAALGACTSSDRENTTTQEISGSPTLSQFVLYASCAAPGNLSARQTHNYLAAAPRIDG